MKKYYVYCCGPMAKGDTITNIRIGIQNCEALLQAGFIPFCPFVDYSWHFLLPKSLEEWLEYDFAWILKCDALFALPGESVGRDKEIQFANKHNIPVFHCMVGLMKWREEQEKKRKQLVDQHGNLVGCELCGVIGCRGGCNKD